MTEKTVDQKLKECKTVIIQNVEKSIQNTMIYRYIKDEKLQNDVRKYTHNTKDGFITLEFYDHEKAKQYYDKANFKDKILIRPFNIYFNVQLNDNEMKKYYFEGVNEDNMRKMFDIARKIGICKIYTSYTSQVSSGKLKPSGVLSFVRKDPITEAQFQGLKQQLADIGVKINVYSPDKGLKCAVMLTDFYEGDLTESQEAIEQKAKDQATKLIKKVLKDDSIISSITATVKRREVADPESKEGTRTVTKVRALVQFTDYDTAINNFEQIRKGFIDIPKAKATLNFYTSETNSYISLYTSGLQKPQNMTEKQFEDALVEVFRKVNKDVVQVNVFPSLPTYVARVYLKNEISGRNFIVDYITYRDALVKYYKSKDNIKFNINVDDKTMRKIKQYEKKAVQMMAGIKNDGDRNKFMHNAKGAHHMPLPQGAFGMVPPIPHIAGMINMPQGNKMPVIGNLPPMPNQPNFNMNPQMGAPQMGMPPSNMSMGGMMAPGMGPGINKPQINPTAEVRAKIDRLYNQKAHFVESCKEPEFENTFKKQLFQNVKFVLDVDLKLDPTGSNVQASKILQNNDIGSIIDFLKKPVELYSKLNRS